MASEQQAIGQPCTYKRCGSSEELRTTHEVMDIQDNRLVGLKKIVRVSCAGCGRAKGQEEG